MFIYLEPNIVNLISGGTWYSYEQGLSGMVTLHDFSGFSYDYSMAWRKRLASNYTIGLGYHQHVVDCDSTYGQYRGGEEICEQRLAHLMPIVSTRKRC